MHKHRVFMTRQSGAGLARLQGMHYLERGFDSDTIHAEGKEGENGQQQNQQGGGGADGASASPLPGQLAVLTGMMGIVALLANLRRPDVQARACSRQAQPA